MGQAFSVGDAAFAAPTAAVGLSGCVDGGEACACGTFGEEDGGGAATWPGVLSPTGPLCPPVPCGLPAGLRPFLRHFLFPADSRGPVWLS